MPSPTEEYLRRLRREMKGNPLLTRRVLEEVADHLAEAVMEGKRNGMSEHESEEEAVRRLGPPDRFVRQFDRFTLPFKFLLIFASVATAVMGVWLVSVIAFVLPAHDPSHIPMWRLITICFFAYSILCWIYLYLGPRSLPLRTAVLTASAAAIAAGLYGIVNMIKVAATGGHFEGYIVLMGIVLCGHGLCTIVYTLLTARIARTVRRA